MFWWSSLCTAKTISLYQVISNNCLPPIRFLDGYTAKRISEGPVKWTFFVRHDGPHQSDSYISCRVTRLYLLKQTFKGLKNRSSWIWLLDSDGLMIWSANPNTRGGHVLGSSLVEIRCLENTFNLEHRRGLVNIKIWTLY